MPKLKTRKSAAKRFKITATGKILRHRAFGSHLLGKKRAKRKRKLRKNIPLHTSDLRSIKRML